MNKPYVWLLVAGLAGIGGPSRPAAAAPPGQVPVQIQAIPGTGAVLITYAGVINATGYTVYRRQVGQAADQAVKVNAEPTPFTWLIDDGGGQGLANGTPLLYSVKATVKGADGTTTEGAASADVVVTPQVPVLGNLFAHDIGTTDPSSVTLEGNVLTIKAAGHELWDVDDAGLFLGTAVAGDYSVSAKLLEKPTGGHKRSGKAGVMIREGLNPGDRYGIVVAMTGRGVFFEGRTASRGGLPEGGQGWFAEVGTDDAATTYPLWLKITKQGGIMRGAQSSDGTNYTQVGTDQDFGRLASVTHGGLGMSAVNINNPTHADVADKYLTAKFDATSIKIE